MIGDPCGIGPEVLARAWASGAVHECCTPMLIGSQAAMRSAVKLVGAKTKVRAIESPAGLSDDPHIIDIFDSGKLDAAEITPGRNSKACGRACAEWLDEADALARGGQVAATVMAPINVEAMTMAGVIDRVMSPVVGESYLFLLSGPLRVMHLTDHIPLRAVCDAVSADLVLRALTTVDGLLKEWGVAAPRIGVAGLNAHAKGAEDQNEIVPGVAQAREQGIDVYGPISPDTVFRQCIEGRYDVVLAMYHDQGHIAIKTWGFSGNCVLMIGRPYVYASVAHGTAYDITGKGIADHTMILAALQLAGNLAAGKGFPEQTVSTTSVS